MYLLVDGHSVIHSWPALRALHQRRPAKAREELIHALRLLHDSGAWRITVVFDGRFGTPQFRGRPSDLIVAYSTSDETADSIIERLVGQTGLAAKITVVTADGAERETVAALGANTVGPEWLQDELDRGRGELDQTLRRINRQARWK